MTDTTWPWESGVHEVNGCLVDRVLRVSTKHMPSLEADLEPWHWGELPGLGITWFWAYEEDPYCDSRPMPEWLLRLCRIARDTYGCNWICLDPEGEDVPGLPIYEH